MDVCTIFDINQTAEGMLSYSFGQLLYEMTMCRPLNAAMIEVTPSNMAAAVRKYTLQFTWLHHLVLQSAGPVIESLLTKDAIKKPLPTVNDLIATE